MGRWNRVFQIPQSFKMVCTYSLSVYLSFVFSLSLAQQTKQQGKSLRSPPSVGDLLAFEKGTKAIDASTIFKFQDFYDWREPCDWTQTEVGFGSELLAICRKGPVNKKNLQDEPMPNHELWKNLFVKRNQSFLCHRWQLTSTQSTTDRWQQIKTVLYLRHVRKIFNTSCFSSIFCQYYCSIFRGLNPL